MSTEFGDPIGKEAEEVGIEMDMDNGNFLILK